MERFPMIRFLTIISLIMFTIPADVTADTGSGPTAGRTITVRGQTSVAAVPDRAELTAGHTNRAETAAKAMAANNAAMETVFTALKALGIAERDMRTAGFSVAPVMACAGRKALIYADSAGVTLGGVLKITEQSIHIPGTRMVRAVEMQAMARVPVAAGEQKNKRIGHGDLRH